MMYAIRETMLYAFALGFYEMLRRDFGRTHESNHDWNDAYDRGGTLAERLFGERV